VTSVLRHIAEKYPEHTVESIWEKIEDIAVKTIISA
jgi:hypothetical protein